MNQSGPLEEDAFVAQVCWQYYVNELTQAEIAAYLGVTRLRVNQAIQKAKSSGMVRVHIESPFLPQIALQEELQERFGLKRVLVAPAHPQLYDFHLPVGAALASHMLDRVKSGDWRRIGVAWGMTLQCTIDRLPRLSCPDAEIISMIGGTSRGEAFNAFGIASGFAARFGARYSLLASPIFLGEEVERGAFLAQENFEKHFKKLESLDVAVLTASNISAKSYLIASGLPEGVTPEGLIAAGAIGDVACRFLDINGDLVSPALDRRTIGIELETLKAVPERILAAAGPHKVDIIRVIARHGIATTLVTDDVTARLLVEKT